jgi:CubicO group peptidase (beta-lactamase class C family)
MAAVAQLPLEFRPGEREAYSNGGFQALGAIIETVSGKDYGDYLQEAVFRPLGMASTSLLADERTAVRYSKMGPGTTQSEWTAIVARQERPGHAAGSGVSTADDMMKLAKALLGDQLLSPPIKARIFPRQGDVWRIGQAGGTMGTNAEFGAYPENGWAIVVLSNFDPPAGELMGEVLRNLLLGKGCTPLSPSDRASPMDRLRQPPANQSSRSRQ